MRILVAEDDPTSRMMLKFALAKAGHEVTCAHDGEQAWEMFLADPTPVVVSDWMMPRCDGPELCRRVRARADEAARAGCPGAYTWFILLTGKSDRESLIEGFDAGADDFVSKPFDPGELNARVRTGGRVTRLEAQLESRVKQIGEAHRRMADDLEAAARVQRALLPRAGLRLPGVDVAWRYEPCTGLAGDIFNVFRLDDTRIGIYLLDVSGHGVASALLSVTLSRTLSPDPESGILWQGAAEGDAPFLAGSAAAADFGPTHGTAVGRGLLRPAKVLGILNRRFPIDPETFQYFTIWYGVLDTRTGRLRYSQGGHPYAAVVRAGGGAELLPGMAPPIGIEEDTTFPDMVAELAAGDRLVVFSDGIPEAMDGIDELMGNDRVLEMLDAGRVDDLPTTLSNLVKAARDWEDADGLRDDASVIALERRDFTRVGV